MISCLLYSPAQGSWSDGFSSFCLFSAWPRWARAMTLVYFIINFSLPPWNLFFFFLKLLIYNKFNTYQYILITTTISDQSINLIIKVLVYQFVYIISLNDKPKCLSICLYHFDV